MSRAGPRTTLQRSLTVLLTGAALVVAPGAAASTLDLTADFLHTSPGADYHTAIAGTLPFDFEVVAANQLAEATFRLDRPASALAMHWYPDGFPGSPAGPVDVWLANASVSAADIDNYLGGIDLVNPSLAIPVVPFEPEGGGDGTWWRNSSPFTAQLFLRGCFLSSTAKYADLQFDTGEFFVRQRIVDGTHVLDISAGEFDLVNIDAATWSFIGAVCPGGSGLSSQAFPGVSVFFEGSGDDASPPPAVQPYLSLLDRGHEIDGLVGQGRLRPSDATFLRQTLERTKKMLRRGRPRIAISHFEFFVGQIDQLESRRRLAPEDAEPLRGAANDSIEIINILIAEPLPVGPVPDAYCTPPDPLPVCQDPSACAHSIYHVNAAELPRGDGSEEHPFATLAQAMAAGAASGACGIEIRLAPGTYSGDLLVNRHLRILGQGFPRPTLTGAVENTTGAVVVLDHVRLLNSEGEHGAIFADHPCATTILRNVAVAGAAQHGVRQRGGALTLFESAVSFTRATDLEDRLSGTGVVVSCGAQARLWGVNLVGNESGGVAAIGPGTSVSATELQVLATGAHPIWDVVTPPDYAWGLGAVQSLAGAEVAATFYSIRNSEGIGAWGTYGGALELANGEIVTTKVIERNPNGAGGRSLAAFAMGTVNAEIFENRRSELCGVTVGPEDGQMDLAHGVVSGAEIGACVLVDAYRLSRLNGRDVVYMDNGINLQGTSFPTPDPNLDLLTE